MSRFGIYGKFTAHSGKRDALVQALLEAAAGLQNFQGCERQLERTKLGLP